MPDLERNKQNVMAFYDLMFNQCRPRDAIERYAGEQYIQHNPGVADGKEGFIRLFRESRSRLPRQARGIQTRNRRRRLRGPSLPPRIGPVITLGRNGHLPPRCSRQSRRTLGRLANRARSRRQFQRHVLIPLEVRS